MNEWLDLCLWVARRKRGQMLGLGDIEVNLDKEANYMESSGKDHEL